MREGDWLIGWGCATATYPSNMSAATARVKLGRGGDARVQIAAHEIGTGAYTVIGQMAAVRLGVPLEKIKVELGDSALPPGPIAGGSCTTASACSAVLKACDMIRDRLLRAATSAPDSPLAGLRPELLSFARGHIESPGGNRESIEKVFERLGIGVIEQYAEWLPHGASADALSALYNGHTALVGGPMKDRISYAYGAEFVEVRVNASTREIRVPRIVGAFAAGHIMNPRTARSQYMGAMIWGISSALHEETEIDRLRGRYVNHNFADYLVPVNATSIRSR